MPQSDSYTPNDATQNRPSHTAMLFNYLYLNVNLNSAPVVCCTCGCGLNKIIVCYSSEPEVAKFYPTT